MSGDLACGAVGTCGRWADHRGHHGGWRVVPAVPVSEGLPRLLAAVDALLRQDPEADPLPDDEWDPAFIELREARAALAERGTE